jgi:hypothetical protein
MRLEKEPCRRRYMYIYTRHHLYFFHVQNGFSRCSLRDVMSVVVMWQSDILPCSQLEQSRAEQSRLH